MTILFDAGPIIFLGKINQLWLISELFKGDILLPQIIKSEILTPLLPPAEERALTLFLKQCKIEITEAEFSSKALSYTDNCILTYAVRNKVDILLSDDRLVRNVAFNENIRPIGTLGILLLAMKKSLLNPQNIRGLINELIHNHKFRISIDVFEAVLDSIEDYRKSKRK